MGPKKTTRKPRQATSKTKRGKGLSRVDRRETARSPSRRRKLVPAKVTPVLGLPGVQIRTFTDGSTSLSLGPASWPFPDTDSAKQMLAGLRDLHGLAVGRLRHHSSWNAQFGEDTELPGTRKGTDRDGALVLTVGRTGLLKCETEEQAEQALQDLGEQFFEWQAAAPAGERFDYERDDGPGSFGDGALFDDKGRPHPQAMAKIQRILNAAGVALGETARTALQNWPTFNRWMLANQPGSDQSYRKAVSELAEVSEKLAITDSDSAEVLSRAAAGALLRISAFPTGRTAGIAETAATHLLTLVDLMTAMEAPFDERPIAGEIATRLGQAFDNIDWATNGFLLFARECVSAGTR